MKIIPLFILFAFIFCACDPEDQDSPEPEDLFVKFYGGVGDAQSGVKIIEVDEGFVIFGQTNSRVIKESIEENDEDVDFLLLKTDNAGNEIWHRTYDSQEGDLNDFALNFKQTNDNGFVMVGTSIEQGQGSNISSSINTSVFVVKVNSTGENEWSYTGVFSDIEGVDLGNEATDIVVNDDGTYTVVGSTSNVDQNKPGVSASGLFDLRDVLLFKLSENGTLIWRRVFGFNGSDIGVNAFGLDNGGVAIIGQTDKQTRNGEGGVNVLFATTNAEGFSNQLTVYGFDQRDEYPASVVSTLNQTFTIVGTSMPESNQSIQIDLQNFTDDPNIFTMSISSTGNLLFNTRIDTIQAQARGITRIEGGDIIITGALNEAGSDEDGINKNGELIVLKVDQLGGSPNLTTFGGTGDDFGNDIIQSSDGKLVITGQTDFQGGASMLTLMKTNIRGQLK